MRVPQYISQARVEPFRSTSRSAALPPEMFLNYKADAAIKAGGAIVEWATKRQDLRVKSEAASADAALQTQLNELEREQTRNPDPHAADAAFEAGANRIYKSLLQSPKLTSGRSRSTFQAESGLKVSQSIHKFRIKNDEKILAQAAAITEGSAQGSAKVVVDVSMPKTIRAQHLLDIFGTNSGPGSFALANLPKSNGYYLRAVADGTMSLEGLRVSVTEMREQLYEGILLNYIMGAADPTDVVIKVDEGWDHMGEPGYEMLDPIMKELAPHIDPAKVAEIHDSALNKAEAIEKARSDQLTQMDNVRGRELDHLHTTIYNTDKPAIAIHAYDLLRDENYFSRTDREGADTFLKTKGWMPGESKEFPEKSFEPAIRQLQSFDSEGILSHAHVDLAADTGTLSTGDYLDWKRRASQERTDAKKSFEATFKLRFRYEQFKDSETELLGHAPTMAYHASMDELEEWSRDHPTASPSALKVEARNILERRYTDFRELLTRNAHDYINGWHAPFNQVDTSDPIGWLRESIANGTIAGDHTHRARRYIAELLELQAAGGTITR